MNARTSDRQNGVRWRDIGWGAAAAILMAPLLAMQFTDEVAWEVADFVIAGLLLGAVGIAFEFAMRRGTTPSYHAAAAVGLLGLLSLIWANFAVGLIGSEADSANTLYIAVVGAVIVGAIVAALKPRGMARAMAVTAAVHLLITAIAFADGLGPADMAATLRTLAANLFFVAVWLVSAYLFRIAALAEPVEERG